MNYKISILKIKNGCIAEGNFDLVVIFSLFRYELRGIGNRKTNGKIRLAKEKALRGEGKFEVQ